MPDVNLIAIFVATVVTFVLGGFYYAILGRTGVGRVREW